MQIVADQLRRATASVGNEIGSTRTAATRTEPQGGELFCSGCRMLSQLPSAFGRMPARARPMAVELSSCVGLPRVLRTVTQEAWPQDVDLLDGGRPAMECSMQRRQSEPAVSRSKTPVGVEPTLNRRPPLCGGAPGGCRAVWLQRQDQAGGWRLEAGGRKVCGSSYLQSPVSSLPQYPRQELNLAFDLRRVACESGTLRGQI